MGRGLSAYLLFALFAISCVNAQQADTGGAIASISAGGTFGLGAHGAVDGSVAVPASKYLLPYIDFTYSPLATYSFSFGSNLTAGKGLSHSYLLDVNGGLEIRFPRSRKSDWVPYVGFGAGLLRIATNTHETELGANITSNQVRDELAGNASAGGLYYITPHVGLKIEAKGYFTGSNRLGQATVGVFYQFE